MQRTPNNTNAVPNPRGRSTTFLTVEPQRTPSAYHVDALGNSQRARQDHDRGPTVTHARPAVHGFTATRQRLEAVTRLVHQSMQVGWRGRDALRLEILDGLVRPTLRPNDHHLEAFDLPLSRANPHRSGGTVQFPDQATPLSNFNHVVAQTLARRQELQTTGAITTPAVQTSHGNIGTAEARRFNANAVQAQRDWFNSWYR